jgi:hypothetical protein
MILLSILKIVYIKTQVNISKHSEKKWWQLFYFGITDMGNTICPGHLVAGIQKMGYNEGALYIDGEGK